MAEALLDASAVLALLQDEAGSAVVGAALATAALSAINAVEVLARLGAAMADADAQAAFSALELPLLPFTAAEIGRAEGLVRRHRGVLSLADCACIATAQRLAIPVLTADRVWATLPLGVEVRLIRP